MTEQQVAAQSVRVDLADFGRISTILNSGTPASWAVTGDSITHGALWTNGWRIYAEHFQERIRWELGKPKNSDFVLDTGVSGSTTNDLRARFTERVVAFSLPGSSP
ncbi:SGNH/GDSL hydrolase family protein [Streptomyces anulatus]|uniref:SGNH/GDSL hydrolase family protein n=1 Tax=Streptomyces anulatus TaxID=1892 RepID=UPI00364C7153